ncbi:MAG: hypothetical protein ACUVWR_07130 [Anaerolineae bacterium]
MRKAYLWCLLTGISLPLAFAISSILPVDTHALAWSRLQGPLLFLYIACLAVPFLLAGISFAICLESAATAGAIVYGSNLAGSAIGAVLAAICLPSLGAARTVILAGVVAATAAEVLLSSWRRWLVLLAVGAVLLPWDRLLIMRMSPYKPLWQALHAQGASNLATYWSRSGRVDVVAGPNLRMAGGVALDCPYPVPAQRLIFLDGDNPRPITEAMDRSQAQFVRCLPGWAAFRVRPPQRILVLEPAGDVPIWLAEATTASQVQVVEPSGGVAAAFACQEWGSAVVSASRVSVSVVNVRAFLHKTSGWDAIYFPLRGGYRPIGWGATSLTEDYGITVESFSDALAALAPGGVLIAETWLQQPPSEPLRLWLTLIAALRSHGVTNTAQHLLAARSMQTMLILASPREWTGAELMAFRSGAETLGLDLVWLPDLREAETNRINVLPEESFYHSYTRALLDDRTWLASYPFSVIPATDERPFPHDYFKWSQTAQILRQVGRTSQPFGGLGFLILPFMLLILTPLALATLAPVLLRSESAPRLRAAVGFFALGLGYMAVELPLMQQALLVLREVPTAMAVVLGTMLVGSGAASLLTGKYKHVGWTIMPVIWTGSVLVSSRWLISVLLAAPDALQILALVAYAALVGFGLGGAFPTLMAIAGRRPGERAWALAINGSASVLSSVLTTAIAVLWSFKAAYGLAMAAYTLVAAVSWRLGKKQEPW